MNWAFLTIRNVLLPTTVALVLSLSSVSGNAACTGNDANKAVISGATGANNVAEGASVTAAANVGNGKSFPLPANGGIYIWSWVSGPLLSPALPTTSTASVTFTVPKVTAHYGQLVLQLAVSSAACPTADVATMTYNLTNLNNFAPVADAKASPSTTTAGNLITLDGVGSYDPDSDPIRYQWKQKQLPAPAPASPLVTLSDAHAVAPTFTAPIVATTTTFRFELTVTENYTGSPPSAVTTVDVSVEVPNNHAPHAALACPTSVDEGQPFTLTSQSTDADTGDSLTYDWAQEVAAPLVTWPDDRTGSQVSFAAAPILGLLELSPMKFILTVSDGEASDSANCKVSVNDKTGPAIVSPDITFEATSPTGEAIWYDDASAFDAVDGSVLLTCLPPSGSTFRVGPATEVKCTAEDTATPVNSSSASFHVTVQDTTKPVIDAHGPVIKEATGPGGAVVDYGPINTSDVVDVDLVASCEATSGSTFDLGPHTVTCNATDFSNNIADFTTFSVTVQDTTKPLIDAHGPVVEEATSPLGAVVDYGSINTFDVVDVDLLASCEAASGSTFGLGQHSVTCNATDFSNNIADSTTFRVIVQDTTPPVIHDTPGNISVSATSAAGASVTINALPTASDIFGASVVCKYSTTTLSDAVLAAGATNFPVGTTTVACTATDGNGLTSQSAFTVYVHYNFSGFLQPIDNVPTVNSVKAGSAIPVKFTLGGDMSLDIFLTKAGSPSPASIQMTCGGAAEDAVEETLTAGGSSLSYDAGTGMYIYVWKTEKSWIGTCRQLQVKLKDGTNHVANFKFK